jgi:hypothetical protein
MAVSEAATVAGVTTPSGVDIAQYSDEAYRVAISDTFTRSIGLGSGWGSPDQGPAYTYPNGGSTKFGVNGTQGQMAIDVANSVRMVFVDTGAIDEEVTFEFTMPTQDTAQTQQFYVIARGTDLNNFYALRLAQTITNGGALALAKRVASVQSDSLVVFNISSGTLVPGSQYWLKLAVIGSRLFGKYWLDGSTEPGWLVQITDTDLTTGTNAGFRGFVPTGSTVLPTILLDNLTVKQATTADFITSITTVSALEEHDIPDSATISSKTTPSATETAQYVESSTIASVTSVSALEEHDIFDSATISSVTTVSGTDVYTPAVSNTDAATIASKTSITTVDTAQYIESSIVAGITTPSATDVAADLEAATITGKTTPSATDVAAYVESATLSSKTTLSSTDVSTGVDSSTGAIVTTPSSTDFAAYVESSTINGVTTPSGVDIFPTINLDAGTCTTKTTITPVEIYVGIDAANLSTITSITYSDFTAGADSNTVSSASSAFSTDTASYAESVTFTSITYVSAIEQYVPAPTFQDAATVTSKTYIGATTEYGPITVDRFVGFLTSRWISGGMVARFNSTTTSKRWISTEFVINRLVGMVRSKWTT